MNDAIEMHHESEFGDLELEMFIHGSHVLADVSTSDEVANLYTLRNLVQSAIASVTDPLAFLVGQHVHVEIFAVITPSGHKQVFGVEYEYISEKLSSEEVYEEWLPKVLSTYGTDASPYLQRCFTDFRLAMEHAEDTGFYCFRAVESLRHYFKDETTSTSESWQLLREATKVERETIENNIQDFAAARRHGDVITITADERRLALETTWGIIQEFIKFVEPAS